MHRLFRSLYLFFRSLKLTLVLLTIIAALSISATIVPQGRESEFYREKYGALAANLFTVTGFDHLFRSPLFLAPTCVFFVNLAACTFGTLVSRLRSGRLRSYGGRPIPPLSQIGFFTLHLGILALIAGGVVSLIARKEAGFLLSEGDSVRLAYGYTLRLKSFEYLRYPDGRPKDWLSTVEVEREGSARAFTIAVNKPLRLGRVKIYQNTYGETLAATLTDDTGVSTRIIQGRHIRYGDAFLFFKGVEAGSGKAVFERWEEGKISDRYAASAGETVNGLRVEVVAPTIFTGLKAVRDPGFVPVVLSFLLIASGVSATFIQKLGEKE